MTISDIREILIKQKVPRQAYSLDGGLPNEAYCINQIDGNWEVYYSERGVKSGLKIFASENEACKYLYRTVMQRVMNLDQGM